MSHAVHASLSTQVAEHERDRALQQLRAAYDSGALTPTDYDRRAGTAALATTRVELNSAFLGLVAPQDWNRPVRGRALATVAHLSSAFWLVGPLVCFAAAPAGSYARREAAKAFNFTFGVSALFAVVMVGAAVLGAKALLAIAPVIWLVWFGFTVVSAAKAAQGIDWTNPLRALVPFSVLEER